jgi:hypothetical protein
MHYYILYLCLHVVYSILYSTCVYKYYIIHTIQMPADILESTQEQVASTVQLHYFTSIPKVNTVWSIVRQAHFRDGILGHHLNKRLEPFAPCFSQSLLQADFKENHTLL